jgi:arsenate reductase-like glutaredoxin family protein
MGNYSIINKIIDEYYNDEIDESELKDMLSQEGCSESLIRKIEKERKKLENIISCGLSRPRKRF